MRDDSGCLWAFVRHPVFSGFGVPPHPYIRLTGLDHCLHLFLSYKYPQNTRKGWRKDESFVLSMD